MSGVTLAVSNHPLNCFCLQVKCLEMIREPLKSDISLIPISYCARGYCGVVWRELKTKQSVKSVLFDLHENIKKD